MIDRNQGLHQMDAMRLYSGLALSEYLSRQNRDHYKEGLLESLSIRPSAGE